MLPIFKIIILKEIRKIVLPIALFLLLSGLYLYYKINILPNSSNKIFAEVNKYIGVFFILSAIFVVNSAISTTVLWIKTNIISDDLDKSNLKSIYAISKIVKTLVWLIAFLMILPIFGINITALIATLGVGSLAIALAAQDTIANVISGFMIMIDAPFRVGDKIKIPSGETVEVLDIGVRRSKFLLEEEAIIIIPNLDLSKNKIINYTYGKERKGEI